MTNKFLENVTTACINIVVTAILFSMTTGIVYGLFKLLTWIISL